MHATILAYMFSLVELSRISVPLGPSHDNTLYVQEFVASLLRAAFPHLSDNQIKITVQGLFNLDQDIPAFKEHLRDFLVQIRVRLLSMYDTVNYFMSCSVDSLLFWCVIPRGFGWIRCSRYGGQLLVHRSVERWLSSSRVGCGVNNPLRYNWHVMKCDMASDFNELSSSGCGIELQSPEEFLWQVH